MSLKGLYVKGLVANLWHFWETMETLKRGVYWNLRHWGCVKEEDIKTPLTPSTFASSLTWGEAALFPASSHHDVLPHYRAKQQGQVAMNWNFWNQESKQPFPNFKLFILSILSQKQKASTRCLVTWEKCKKFH
jgi:hypothetical protein